MADDYNSRYRSGDPYGRPAAHEQGGQHHSDPLAELARLIGQNDPFSEYGRDSRAAPHDQSYAPDPHYGAPPAAPAYGQPQPPQADWQQGYATQPAPAYDPFAPSHAAAPAAAPVNYPEQSYAAPQPSYEGYQPAEHQQQFAQAAYGDPAAPQFQPAAYQQHDGSLPPPHADEFYDDAPSRRRGLVTVAAVLGLAVVGTAGAFGYRSMFSAGGVMGPPPVIRASAEPTKVAPPPPAPSDSAAKITYDRFAESGQNNERVAVREEPPVDINSLARGAAAPPPPVTAPSAPPAAATPPSVLTEPRRVRTERIRPEIEGGARQATVPPMASPATSRQAAVPPTASPPPPTSRQPAVPPPEARSEPPSATLPPPPPRTAAPRAQRQAPPPPSGNAPLSLSPDGNAPPASAARQQQPRMRVASVPSGSSSSSGGFLVQVSSQRSESEAQAAFRSLQSKYSSVLGGQQVVVRRADLGDKGIYYRAMVGPFGSRDQAIQLCTSLKAAGGNCLIQGN